MADTTTSAELGAKPLPFRIGIVGGMGPLAGVYLQQLIIEATPAERDQDHFQVVCFTNPRVPERMRSLAEDGGRRYAEAVRDAARLVARAGATHIVIPCNTAHARLDEIRQGVTAPIVDMIALGIESLVRRHGSGRRVGLLATTGTLEQRVYQVAAGARVSEWILPDAGDQECVSRTILAIKAGRGADAIGGVVDVSRQMAAQGAEVLVVGCTELSMHVEALRAAGLPLIDPLRVVAGHLVELGRSLEAGGR